MDARWSLQRRNARRSGIKVHTWRHIELVLLLLGQASYRPGGVMVRRNEEPSSQPLAVVVVTGGT